MRIVADGWSEQIDADRNPHIQPDQLYRDRLTQLSRMWNRRATPPAAPAGGERETLRQLFEDHYWDSFQTDKQIVMKHVNCVLDFWAASQGAFERSDIALDGQEVAGCSARKCPEPGEAGVEGSIPSRSTNIATPAQSIDDEREREAAIERIISIRNGMTTDPEARAIVRRELAALAALKETT